MSTAATAPAPLWLLDRSRKETEHSCEVSRYLGYHFGPSGYGIQRKAESIPLTTGAGTHVGTQGLGEWAKAHPDARELPLEVIRENVKLAREAYEKRAIERGIAGWADEKQLEYLIGEQSALIGGLLWCAGLVVFPWLLDSYEVVEVEVEEIRVVGCSCGLTSDVGTLEEHEARGCTGIGFMSKPDLITRSRTRPDSYQYWEYKTTGRITKAWQESWETKIQFHAGIVATEKRLGIRIDETFVIGLYKGSRESDKEGGRYQSSVCCYGYRREAKPPLQEEGWEALWDDDQRTPKRLDWRTWKRTPIWTQAGFTDGHGMDPVEYWMRWIPSYVREKQVAIVGPMNRQEVLIENFFEALPHAELRVQQGVWAVYQALEANDWRWSAPEVQATVNQHFERSWQCRKFGSDHDCQFVPLCFQKEGWEDPLGSGKYVLRRPHHEPELQQALNAGVLPSDEGMEGDEE